MGNGIPPDTSRAWVDVDLGAIVRNARSFAAATGVPMLPMLKADGYGLGSIAVARALEAVAPWGYGVATLDEAAVLRRALPTYPVVAFTPLVAVQVDAFRRHGVRPAIGDVDALRAWQEQGGGPFHLEIDTGMSRSGVPWDDVDTLAAVRNLVGDGAGWEGIFTMFHSAERDAAATAEQWARLQQVIEALGRRPTLVHAAASAGGAYGPQFAGDLTRPGIHLYGGRVRGLDAEPVASLRGRVVARRQLAAGTTVSYDATWTASAPTTIVTVALGYADGVHRALSNGGLVELHGERLRIAGRVTMDHLMVDVGALPVQVGDVATLFGGAITLDEQATLAGTISYELLTSLGSRLPRRYGDHA